MTADLIKQPQQWQLLMEASSSELAVVAYSPYEEPSMIYETLPCGGEGGALRRLENVVYDNPALLADFGRVTMLYDTLRVLPVPDASDEVATALFRSVYRPDGADSKVLVSHLPEAGMALCCEIPSDIGNFVRRTFPCVTIEHPLAPLYRYFHARYPTRRRGKTLVNLRGKRMDMIVLGERSPLALSSHRIEAPMDAVYYIMAAREKLALPVTDEIMISGDRVMRAAITPILRRYVRYVMPAIFPSVMFHAGRASLSAPFELIVIPLITSTKPSCE